MSDEKQKAFEAWWSDPATSTGPRPAFFADWDAALANRQDEGDFIVNQIKAERTILRDKIMDKAVVAFRAGFDGTARVYRELASELFGKI